MLRACCEEYYVLILILKQKMIILFGLFLYTTTVSTEKTNPDNIYYKFHQSDYDVIFEWMEIVRFTQPEVKDLKLKIFKYNRTTPALNTTVGFNIDVGNELEIVIQRNKFLSNEYRNFPLRVQVNFCKCFNRNTFGLAQFTRCGNFTRCPFRQGQINHICNWTLDQSQLPPFIPAGRYMAEIQGLYRNKELFVTRAYAAATRSIVKK